MKLVIVESPSKAKTINKYLGKDYKVLASFGHVRKLPSKKGSVDTENNFLIKWEETTQAKKHLKEIVDNAKNAQEIYLATDPDREGEAISWHIMSYLKEKKILKNKLVKRIVFNSITKQNVLKAFENPRDLNNDLIAAYLTRVSLDYLVGFSISPILWRKLPGSRSAGRVQSVALRLICERENEIENFKSQEYWSIISELEDNQKNVIQATLHTLDNKVLGKLDITNEKQAKDIEKTIKQSTFTLTNIDNKKTLRNPPAPFTTSTLQQDAFNKLGFSTRKTMQIAQRLYEGLKIGNETTGLITYIRTDAVQIDGAFISEIRKYIDKKIGPKYISKNTRVYKTKAKNAQEAHEAIRPTDINKIPTEIKSYMQEDDFKLYDLIWKRTTASQMASANYDLCILDITSEDKKIILKASRSILNFEGFYKIYKDTNTNEEIKALPSIPINTKLDVINIEKKQHFTEPPPRFSEATLIKKLEEMGIGRPSTYSGIVSILQEREYTKITNKRFIPEPRGRILNIFLTHFFTNYVEYSFTAELEQLLDEISDNKINWLKVLQNFWNPFNEKIKSVEQINITDVMEVVNQAALHHFVKDNTKCPKCLKGDLQIKSSKFGAFIGCSNYPECNYTHQLSTMEDVSSDININDSQVLGINDNKQEILLKNGPYGYYVEKFENNKTKRISLPKSITPQNITLEQADFLLNLPLKLSDQISVAIGRFGPYIKRDKDFFSLKENLFEITLEKAQKIIDLAEKKKQGILLGKYKKSQNDVILKYGRYGPYLFYNNTNIKIPKKYKENIENIDINNAIEIIDSQKDN